MSTFFENYDGTKIEFGIEICDKFQKFLGILSDIHMDYHINHLSITVFDDGFSDGLFSLHLPRSTISFGAKSNPEGYTLSFKNVLGVNGEIKTNTLQAILTMGDNFSTTIKKPRYEVLESVMEKFCEAKKIKFIYFCG
jgi:hypothetical protein